MLLRLRDQHEDAVPDDLGGKVLVMGPGQSFGELALMYMCPRAASCVASQPTSLWTLGTCFDHCAHVLLIVF